MDSVANIESRDLNATSSSSDNEEDENSHPTIKRPRRHLEWEKLNSFGNIEDAKSYVQSQATWNMRYSRHLMDGKKFYYNCSHDRDCAAQIYLIQQINNQSVDLFSAGDHDHAEVRNKTGLDLPTKTKIKQLYGNGVTRPKLILSALRGEGVAPKVKQIASFVQHNIRNKLGPRVVSLGDMQHLCQQMSGVPVSLDEPYVIDYNIDYDRKKFQIVLSTLRLLDLITKNSAIQADGTYKLMWEGFPVLMFGTSDKDRKFHPFCVAVTSNETFEDFGFCFNALQKSSQNAFNPSILIADCAESITNGFRQVFGEEFQRVHCWANVYRNITENKHIRTLPQTVQAALLADIKLIQLCRSEKEFDTAAKLLILKWSSSAKKFTEYFHEEYVRKYKGWYEGAAVGFASTNNSLEATNRVLKSEGTFHERVNFGLLIQTLKKVLTTWSEERNLANANHKEFSLKPTYTLKPLF